MQYWCSAILLLVLSILRFTHSSQTDKPYIEILNTDILSEGVNSVVYDEKASSNYDDSIFISELNCRNNDLEIINNNQSHQIIFKYKNIPL